MRPFAYDCRTSEKGANHLQNFEISSIFQLSFENVCHFKTGIRARDRFGGVRRALPFVFRTQSGCSIVLGTPAWGFTALYVLSLMLRRGGTEPLIDAMRSVPTVVVIVLAISCVRNFVPLIRLFRATANVSPAGIGFDGKDLLYRSTDIVDVQRVMQRSHDGGTFETLEIELKRPQARSLLRRLVWSLMAPRRDRVVLCL